MPSLKEVKTRISSVVSTQQITKAMKMVAAAKLRRAQDSILQMRPFAEKLNEVLVNVSSGLEQDDSSGFSAVRSEESILIVAITSDRGLCGAFNANIAKQVVNLIETEYPNQNRYGNVHVMTLGKKGYDLLKRREYNLNTEYTDVFSNVAFDNVRIPAEFAMNSFLKGEYDKVVLVYNEFKNIATQIVRTEQFLPITSSEDEIESNMSIDFIFQPDKEVIIEELIPKSLKIQFYKAILESNASEHGARMTAMDKATENAGELLKELRLTYNRSRQAAITKEILEIVGGADAL